MQSLTTPVAMPYSDPRISYYPIEGSIGAGKSTFRDNVVPLVIAAIKKRFGADCLVLNIDEPLQTWIDLGMFEAFNRNKPGHAANFQTVAFSTRIGKFVEAYAAAAKFINSDPANRRAVILSERSWWGDRIFEMTNYTLKNITESQHTVYKTLFECWDAGAGHRKPDMVFWIKTPARTCQNRVIDRERGTEIIEYEYQCALVTEHERQLGAGVFCGAPVHTIDGTQDFKTDSKVCATIADRVAKLIVTDMCGPEPVTH